MKAGTAMIRLDSSQALALVARVCLSAIFLVSGVGKLMDASATMAAIETAGLPFPGLSLAVAVAIELLGGAALVVGYRVQWAAGALAIFTMVAGLWFHADFADQNQFMHLLKNIAITGGLFCVIALQKFTQEIRR
jgi:putative oxidoreductase